MSMKEAYISISRFLGFPKIETVPYESDGIPGVSPQEANDIINKVFKTVPKEEIDKIANIQVDPVEPKAGVQ